MDFRLTSEQELLRDIVQRFVAERYDPAQRPKHHVPESGFDPANWSVLADLGLLALPFVEEDTTPLDSCVNLMIVMEAFGRGAVAEPYLAHILLSGQLLARAGTPAQKRRWIASLAAGSAHVALAHAEAYSPNLLDQITTACQDGKLTGRKTFVLAGAATDAFIVSARDATGSAGLFLVESAAAGVSRRSYRLLDGSTALEIDFRNTPAEPLAGDVTELLAVIDLLRLPIAAEMLGLMSLLFDVTLNYIRTRRQFGATIGSFQAIQHRMADQYVALEQSRSLVLRAALMPGAVGASARLAAKAYLSEAGVRLGEECIQLHGGIGVTDELIIGHAHKRLLLLATLFGDADTELLRYNAAQAATASTQRVSMVTAETPGAP